MKIEFFYCNMVVNRFQVFSLELECVIILLCGVNEDELENQFIFMNSETKKRRREWRDI